jgi:3-oxoacid CoA-transferase subunit A
LVAEGKETREFFRPSEGVCGCTVPGKGFAGRAIDANKPGSESRGTQNGSPRAYVMETGLYADLALVRAHTADTFGNLVYRKTARNFNPMMATGAAFVIAEVERVVETGELDGDSIHTPGSYVDRVVKTTPEKRIEQRTVSK